ncbi:nucleoside diphosphate kinase B-like [Paramormyrops kingsleyae]|uniref:Nucleoside diphosphate kinase n=1 Tax=Paramormyrops kingsleyae TaxID=1676925 RepID=A0A3B3RUT5_9TELE|nr:nucleoside diphosphate kinase, mitochondrial-like [Paramormyrops kingsleyae]
MVLFQRCLTRTFSLGQRKLSGSPQQEKVANMQAWASIRPHYQSCWVGARSYGTEGAGGLSERTLIAVKPDGVQRRLVGQIIQRFEKRGFKLVGLKMLKAPEELLSQHYHDLSKKPFYPSLLRYMGSGPLVVMVWEGYNVVSTSRKMVGDTNPAEAPPGSIRGDFSIHISRNVVHASDSLDGAQREIQLWFNCKELTDWDCHDQSSTFHL